MSPFALRLRTLNATALGNESAFRQETGRSASARSTQPVAALGSGARVVTWFQLANVRLTTQSKPLSLTPVIGTFAFWCDRDVRAGGYVRDRRARLEPQRGTGVTEIVASDLAQRGLLQYSREDVSKVAFL
jgi:hypothetical protein